MAFDFPVPMFAAVDFWMTRWLTPVWFLGGGVILGLLVLSVFLVVFYCLSKFTQFEKFRRDGSAHFLALAVTLVLGGRFRCIFEIKFRWPIVFYSRWSLCNRRMGDDIDRFNHDDWRCCLVYLVLFLSTVFG